MKLVFTFFLLLCFYLPATYGYAPTSSLHFGCSLAMAHIQNQKGDAKDFIPYYNISRFAITGDNPELLGIEEEDDEPVFRKQVPRWVSVFSRINFSNPLNCPPGSLSLYSSLCNAISCKYITQRVLRI